MAKIEVVRLRQWIMSGKKHDYIAECTGCGDTHLLKILEDLFHCRKCGLDLRSSPSKAGRFTVYKERLLPVFPWSDPIKKIRKKKVVSVNSLRGKKRKTFDG